MSMVQYTTKFSIYKICLRQFWKWDLSSAQRYVMRESDCMKISEDDMREALYGWGIKFNVNIFAAPIVSIWLEGRMEIKKVYSYVTTEN